MSLFLHFLLAYRFFAFSTVSDFTIFDNLLGKAHNPSKDDDVGVDLSLHIPPEMRGEAAQVVCLHLTAFKNAGFYLLMNMILHLGYVLCGTADRHFRNLANPERRTRFVYNHGTVRALYRSAEHPIIRDLQ